MIGAAQWGLLAACVVLFVPMAMAGWHLSRNKILFFSCALFISLAVGVHLMPYFPSITAFLSPSAVIHDPYSVSSDSCIRSLHSVTFSGVGDCEDAVFSEESRCRKWDWVESTQVSKCDFQKLKKSDVSDLLNGSWVVVAGDSQARLTALSLLTSVMGSEGQESIRGDLFKRHSDYSITLKEIGMKLDFLWAPYVDNLTQHVSQMRQNMSFPDVMVMGAGLWDMLHVNNATEYGVSLKVLRDSVSALLPSSLYPDANTRLLHLFWIGIPKLITAALNTDEKRSRMTNEMCSLYENELVGSKLLSENGGPLFRLDILRLSDLCGRGCTDDGMHYDEVVYDSAVQIMLNALLIESNQKPH